MFLDQWRVASKPIDIPISNKSRIIVGTPTSTYNVQVETFSSDLLHCRLISTPSQTKHFQKGDMVLIHKDNILKKIDSFDSISNLRQHNEYINSPAAQ